ncbi:MAG: 23S rRNA (adenine(2030)-N(6))-methyltransferase RlmJ [Sinobacteraceae bacterium]|nr:23S rRNA (adenine(2030)-N(6))-methyltransferase RlmJ [Nevskiaceae bacterium]MBV9914524.1 23S rRNA (adenine(2030)-N(6))-methyltransferase RlmJ [Nevskiaceae bacterium]
MKYQHRYHAGNFADIHKHVMLLALLQALKRKDKPFVYFETHAGRGAYDLAHSAEAIHGCRRFAGGRYRAPELRAFEALLRDFRSRRSAPEAYPGSPCIAALQLREVDRAVLCECMAAEAAALARELQQHRNMHIERDDGFARLKAWLPPAERRALIFIDPPYEQSRNEFAQVTNAIVDAVRRFATGIYAIWYPIKEQRTVRTWQDAFAQAVRYPTVAAELWLYPPDSAVALNGSGMLIVNPPYQLAEHAGLWQTELQLRLDVGSDGGGTLVRALTPSR